MVIIILIKVLKTKPLRAKIGKVSEEWLSKSKSGMELSNDNKITYLRKNDKNISINTIYF
jgi:hypothetical protein